LTSYNGSSTLGLIIFYYHHRRRRHHHHHHHHHHHRIEPEDSLPHSCEHGNEPSDSMTVGELLLE
jgi:hypothetical protein